MKIKYLFKQIISDCFDDNEKCLEAFSDTIKILKEISNLKGDKNKLYDIFQKALESDDVLTKDAIVILSKKFDKIGNKTLANKTLKLSELIDSYKLNEGANNFGKYDFVADKSMTLSSWLKDNGYDYDEYPEFEYEHDIEDFESSCKDLQDKICYSFDTVLEDDLPIEYGYHDGLAFGFIEKYRDERIEDFFNAFDDYKELDDLANLIDDIWNKFDDIGSSQIKTISNNKKIYPLYQELEKFYENNDWNDEDLTDKEVKALEKECNKIIDDLKKEFQNLFDMERDKIIKSIEKFHIQESKPKRKANLKESHMPTFRQYINGNY